MTTETLSSCCQKVKEDSDWSAGLAIHFQQRKIEELEKKLAAAKRESFKTEVTSRSEERRVGKACRSRWSP